MNTHARRWWAHLPVADTQAIADLAARIVWAEALFPDRPCDRTDAALRASLLDADYQPEPPAVVQELRVLLVRLEHDARDGELADAA